MGPADYIQFLIALGVVIALLLGLSWVARRSGLAGRLGALTPTAKREKRLKVLEALPLDSKKRLVLLQWDNREHLVLLNPGSAPDLLIDSATQSETRPPESSNEGESS